MIKFYKILSLLLFSMIVTVSGQRKIDINKLHSDYVKTGNKIKRLRELNGNLKSFAVKHPSKYDYKNWIKILYQIESLYIDNPEAEKIIGDVLKNHEHIPVKLLYVGIETATAVFPDKFHKIISKIFETTRNASVFVISATYLIRNNFKLRNNEFYLLNIEKRFKNWENIPELFLFHEYLLKPEKKRLKEIPDLAELFSHKYSAGKTIIFSLFRKDRNYPGITIIRKPDGKFLRDKDGKLFYVKQLGLSYANLPGYLPDGNTPEGIFSIVGWYITPTGSIGPTPNVLTRLPFEIGVPEFFHQQVSEKKWTKEIYGKLLPPSWSNYLPVYETYYAGRAGRKLLIMHGSTDDLEYYKDKPYFPLTPTRGCLSAKEIWNETTGKCIESDQAKLMNAFFSTGTLKGFLIVVNIDDQKSPVTPEDVIEKVLKAEAMQRK